MQKKVNIHNRSLVEFHELFIDTFENEDEYILGRKDIGVYINVPHIAIESIKLLNLGKNIEQVESQLLENYGEEIDVKDFVQECLELGLIKKIDEIYIELPINNEKKHLTWITQSISKFFFNKYSWYFYIFASISSLLLYLCYPKSLPIVQDFLFHDSLTIVVLVGLPCMWGILLFHELGHLISARSYGIDGKIKFGYQQIYLEIETIIPNLWALKRNERIRIYLAGLAFSGVMLFISLIFVIFYDYNVLDYSSDIYRFLRFINILNVWMFCTQLMIFIKSDLYYVVNDFLKCTDLNGNSAIYFKKLIGRKIKKKELNKLASVSKYEVKMLNYYLPFYLFGLLFSFIVSIGYLTLSGYYIYFSISRMYKYSISSLNFWDEFFSSAYLATPVIWLLIYLIRDKYKQSKKVNKVILGEEV
jgi:putative peptide zinc metalloprotease protein